MEQIKLPTGNTVEFQELETGIRAIFRDNDGKYIGMDDSTSIQLIFELLKMINKSKKEKTLKKSKNQ
jgi:hypothetical protein